ncbi:conserved Plasmodium protein, unknown function [Babesia microti strain RI]|uniref:Uncharacterized protein n=1 Tax=Babesia microti (strain RI) TaxID=1133968 RepID=A0A1N6LXA6_BABMR|nr:conserved Plasmodium protein, unknown function [Babesia microti strain RI]SIO73503.1 conserved Plasmodium protein, unknown function [Babesia microti strain RI]|eukprot:XP_021337597.1 conserved Plasmodium protein, unknown function [Babesia microti strain RI]
MPNNYDIYDMFDPSKHTIFVAQSHITVDTVDNIVNNDSTLNSLTLTQLERAHAMKAVTMLLLCKSPFPIKHEDIRTIVMRNLGTNYTSNALKQVLNDVNDIVRNTLGLRLTELKYSNKKEYVLSQNFCYQPHNIQILSPGSHEIRGFVLFLIPCFRAHSDCIFIDNLISIFQKIGKSHLVPNNVECTKEMLCLLKTQRRSSNAKHRIEDYKSLTDYLIYARDLLYIAITIKNDAFDSFISPGSRIAAEHNPGDYVEMLKKITPGEFDKSLDFLIPTHTANDVNATDNKFSNT